MTMVSVLPALLLFILLFMESQITALIASKRVMKGTGFHADLLIIVLVGGVSALFGLPWLSAATVRSVTHTNALTITEQKPRPQEPRPQEPRPQEPRPQEPRPQEPRLQELRPLLREQRVTGFVVALLVGLSVLVAGLLRQIPVSVLFGVFLYMGVMSLQGVQLTERLQLLLQPSKHHPKSGYVHKVRPWRMHLYTLLQLSCLVVLWLVMASPLALAFPFVLLLTIPLRKLLLPLVFTARELQLLDGEEPEAELEQDEYEQLQMPV
ncbi:anion exchange protein 2a [Eucyclogobius newberryi]|uniref:anion exchange protein 2a n=1 Tax=Eucyclogobius newberryi TaxID=166745 RepID=UPI003B5B73F7